MYGVSAISETGLSRPIATPTNPRLIRLFLATVVGCTFALMFDLITAKTWVVVTGVTILACVAHILKKACSPSARPERRKFQPSPITVVTQPSMTTASADDKILAAILKKAGYANLEGLPAYIGELTFPKVFGDAVSLSPDPIENIMRAKADGKPVLLIKLHETSASKDIVQILIFQDLQWRLYSNTKDLLGLGMMQQGSQLTPKASTGLISILEGGSCGMDTRTYRLPD